MSPSTKRIYISLAVGLLTNAAAFGAEMDRAAVDSADFSGRVLRIDKPTALDIRLQVLLDRAHFSPGEIDGKFGENAKKALRAYEETKQLPAFDTLTVDVWLKLRSDDRPVIANYTVTEKDVAGPFLRKRLSIWRT